MSISGSTEAVEHLISEMFMLLQANMNDCMDRENIQIERFDEFREYELPAVVLRVAEEEVTQRLKETTTIDHNAQIVDGKLVNNTIMESDVGVMVQDIQVEIIAEHETGADKVVRDISAQVKKILAPLSKHSVFYSTSFIDRATGDNSVSDVYAKIITYQWTYDFDFSDPDQVA
ncbi:hypothetical protein AB833_19470 [Chromatiales bacterium (ex Bugula neritina AB1)]|nr:hypothetical protein AB833_19470 [Chromatiales bacterium (ex Bugula neritina AB1)]